MTRDAGARRGVRVWQVEAGGPRTLERVLAAMGIEARAALADGRVWVGRARASSPSLELAVGARVEVHAARASAERASIVAREDGFVVASKPAALPTEADRAGHACLTRQIAELLGVEQVHAVSRLDVGVSGVVLLSEDRRAHLRATELRAQGAIARRYVAISERALASERGSIDEPVDDRPASTRFAVVALAREHLHPDGTRMRPALLALDPVTGRKHQLRLHTKARGAPLLGDRANAGARRLTTESGSVLLIPRIMLHAAKVSLPRASGEPWVVSAPVAADFVETWCALGGAAEDLERAIACATGSS